jgi:hypothetical protein
MRRTGPDYDRWRKPPMAAEGLSPREPDPVEQPTRAAELRITEQSAQVKITARLWGTAEGTVPPGDAAHLITTFGLLGSAVTGMAGAVLTLRIDPRLTGVALAELALVFAVAAMIVACGRGARSRAAPARTGRPPRRPGAAKEHLAVEDLGWVHLAKEGPVKDDSGRRGPGMDN